MHLILVLHTYTYITLGYTNRPIRTGIFLFFFFFLDIIIYQELAIFHFPNTLITTNIIIYLHEDLPSSLPLEKKRKTYGKKAHRIS